MKALKIQSLLIDGCSEINFECELGKTIFVDGLSNVNRLNFLECIAAVTNPIGGKVLYKDMPVHDFKKSYFKRGRVFVGNRLNHYIQPGFFTRNLPNQNKTVWKNLKLFAKINNNEEFIYAAVHYFLFHDIVDKKLCNLDPCEQELVRLCSAMFFENIDFWILYIDDTKITDLSDIKIIRHLIQSRSSDCEGLVMYTTSSGGSIDVSREERLTLIKA